MYLGKGVILISSEEGETESNNDKFLKDFGLVDGNVLACDDFLQNYNLKVCALDVSDLTWYLIILFLGIFVACRQAGGWC